MRFHLFFLELACTTCCTAVDNPEMSYWYYMFFKWTLVEEERKKTNLKWSIFSFFFPKKNRRGKNVPLTEGISVRNSFSCSLPVFSQLFHFILLVSFNFPKTFIYLKTKVFYTFLKAGSGREAASSTGSESQTESKLSEYLLLSSDPPPLLQMEHRNISCWLHL